MPDEAPHTTLSLDRYLPQAKSLIARAQALADERRHLEVVPLHLLARALERGKSSRLVFERATSSVLDFEAAVERALTGLPQSKERSYLSDAMLDLLGRAERDASLERAPRVTTAHLLNALSQEIRGAAGEILSAFGVVPGSLRHHVGLLDEKADTAAADAGAPTDLTRPVLDSPRAGDPVIARGNEVRRLVTILERRQKNHPLLVGEVGVGKRAIVRALAKRIAAGDVPTRLVGARVVELELGAAVAGTRLRGDVEERLRKLFAQLAGTARGGGEHILFISGLEQLLGQGPTGSSLADALRLALSRGDLRVLATTTPDGLRRLTEKDPLLLRSFSEILVEEPSVADAIEIVRGVAQSIEQHHGVPIQDRAVVASVELAKRYLQDRRLPDAAIDLLDESAAAKRVETDGMPLELDRLLQRLSSLNAQLAALADEEDVAAKELAAKLDAERASIEPRASTLRATIEGRRSVTAAVKNLRAEHAAAEQERQRAAENKNFARLGELEHVTLPELGKRVAEAEEAARAQGGSVESPKLQEQDVAATLAAWTGIPVDRMLEAEAEKLLKMEARLSERIVGQDHALSAVARAVRRGRVGLRDPKRPIGSFLLLGPSGVGKTELAKALAEFLFDDEASLTRLDMSEFMERHMAQRLIGAPPGYADSEQGGFLTEAVRRRPYSVLLFDEVEKAHQDVFNLLLQVLDDGRLTDGRGRLADFSNTVVVMTSNIGSERILSADAKLFESEDGRDALRDLMFDKLGQFFRPEFLNRLDDTVVFRPLSKQDLRRIVDIRLRELSRMLAPRKLTLDVSEAAKLRLVDLGYEPALGARPLKRTLLKELQDPLSHALLSAQMPAGGTVKVDLEGDALKLTTVSN
ncbi:MAG: ATPase with chaperone, two ATP-binding domain [Polyangiaceae bacterium]|jgi:ATP-dependent Clp protease ATP-binding subunit ClpB|nr:ATPase with chaperone, two ATP-binding domain [Polyangiaceae bacterium]